MQTTMKNISKMYGAYKEVEERTYKDMEESI